MCCFIHSPSRTHPDGERVCLTRLLFALCFFAVSIPFGRLTIRTRSTSTHSPVYYYASHIFYWAITHCDTGPDRRPPPRDVNLDFCKSNEMFRFPPHCHSHCPLASHGIFLSTSPVGSNTPLNAYHEENGSVERFVTLLEEQSPRCGVSRRGRMGSERECFQWKRYVIACRVTEVRQNLWQKYSKEFGANRTVEIWI